MSEEAPAAAPSSVGRRSPWRNRIRLALLVVAALVLVGGGVAGGIFYENAHWQPVYARAQKDASDFQRLATAGQDELTTLHGKIANTVGDLDHPSFILWNSCGSGGPDVGCPLTPGREYVGGVPDTFTYEINFRSSVPVATTIIPASHYACRYTGACAWGGVGAYWAPTTSLHVLFHDAEGCADYLAIFSSTQAGTLYPNIRVSHNPASHSTGACV